MATQPTKARDAAEAALSAVEEALKLDFGGPDESVPPAPPPLTATAPLAQSVPPPAPGIDAQRERAFTEDLTMAPRTPTAPTGPTGRPVSKSDRAARGADLGVPKSVREPAPPRDLDVPVAGRDASAAPSPRAAANDDRQAVGHLVSALNRRPSAVPFFVALALSILWIGGGIALAVNSGQGGIGALVDMSKNPFLAWMLAGIVLPPVFFWVFALMIWRSQEMRIAARSIADVALRLAEPETNAAEAVASIGQAIRREMNALGDGLDRAVGRASELEVLVHNEVASLTRAYSENELKVRGLIEELVNQREAIVNNSERVRSLLLSSHTTLAGDLDATRQKIFETVDEASERMTSSLASKGAEVTAEIDRSTNEILKSFTDVGSDVAERIQVTGQIVSDTLAIEGGKISERMSENAKALVEGVS
ncbi:MAG: hypothetical protein P4L98_02525, partial [Ancalomicrobiaceae bacterium]|nr:hypothetical protein [Ancalomicrobiaceae bacterium]